MSQTPSLGWRWTEYLVTIYTVVVVRPIPRFATEGP